MSANLMMLSTGQVLLLGQQRPCACRHHNSNSNSSSRRSPLLLPATQRPPQQHLAQRWPAKGRTRPPAAAADSSSGSSSSSSGGGGLARMLRQWKQDTQHLRDQLQSLGLAGVAAYGLLNTLYYTTAFLVVWFTLASAPSGLGLQAAARRAAEVFALVWAGSQVTKLLRAAGALALAPLVDRCLGWAVERLRLKNKQQAFAVVVACCAALAALVFGAAVVAANA